MSHKKRRPFFFDLFKHYVIHNIIHIHNIMTIDNASIAYLRIFLPIYYSYLFNLF